MEKGIKCLFCGCEAYPISVNLKSIVFVCSSGYTHIFHQEYVLKENTAKIVEEYDTSGQINCQCYHSE